MDKKDLNAIVYNMVDRIKAEKGVPEVMARALVGFALQQNSDALVASIQSPKLSIGVQRQPDSAFSGSAVEASAPIRQLVSVPYGGESEADLFPG